MSIYQDHKPAGGSDGLFLDLKDGEKAKIRVASEPAISSNEYKDPDSGEITLSTKYSWVVWNRDEKKAQIFSRGASIFRQLASLVDDWGEPTNYDCTIKRTGSRLATRWTITPSPKSVDLTQEEQESCEKIDLLKAVKGQWLKDFSPENWLPDAPLQTDEDAPIE